MANLLPVNPERIQLMLKKFGLESSLHEFANMRQIRILKDDPIYVLFNKNDHMENDDTSFKAFTLLSRYGTADLKDIDLLNLINRFNKDSRFTRAYMFYEDNLLVCPLEMECLCVDGATDNMLVEYLAIFNASTAVYAKSIAELIYKPNNVGSLN
jgi:hypothetical protein